MHALLTQPYLVAAVVALGLVLLGTILATHRRLRSVKSRQAIDWKRVQSFRGDLYRPMARLLGEEDYLFLQRQPGFQPAIAGRLRKQRREVLSRYLDRLDRDFTELHRLARTLVRDQSQDRPELVVALVRTSTEFRWNVTRIRFAMWLDAAHLNLGVLRPVDTRGLVDAAVWMQAQIRILHAPTAAPSAA